jgi:hypothetical protein
MTNIVVLGTLALTLLSVVWKGTDPKNYLIKAGILALSMVGSLWSLYLLG